MGISVVVCTYNRLPLLKNCLEELSKQKNSVFEIIAVDDASTDGTKEYLDSLQIQNLKAVHHAGNQGLSPSRNDGIAKASFDLIAFTDDDCLVDEDWLSEIVKGFEDQSIDFASGQTFYVSKNYRGYFPERVVTNLGARWPKGNNLIFRKKVLQAVGGFNHDFDQYNNDDSEIAIRAVAAGFKFKPLPQAFVNHQKTKWTPKRLMQSAKNPSVWVILKKKYPKHYLYFNPPVKLGIFIHPEDYLFILTMPVLLPVLLLRFIFNGQRDFKLFFAKWPLYPFLRRYFIYREALKNKAWML